LLVTRIKTDKDLIEEKRAALQGAETRIAEATANLEFLQRDRQAPFNDTNLSPQESDELNNLTKEKDDHLKNVTEVMRSRLEVENEKNTLEMRLNSNYIVREEELQIQLETMTVGLRNGDVTSLERELRTGREQIKNIEEKQNEIDSELEESNTTVKDLQERVEAKRKEETEKLRRIEKFSNDFEKILNKRKIWIQKREECVSQIRELGTIPADAQKYVKKDVEELRTELHKTKEKLKEFGVVNKKALDQYQQFTRQKAEFLTKKDDLDKGHVAINKLVADLDKKKDEAIYRTFKQVSKNFEEIFKELVPDGNAQLIMRGVKHIQDSQFQDEEEEEGGRSDTPKISDLGGVGIQVQFTGDEARKDMQILSGGQKSLVALTLIFAIQRCDSAAFYLFDEIDAALDSAYRTSVAQLITRQAEKGTQFITTTFKTELVEHGDQWYGIRHQNKVSTIDKITKEEALKILAEVDQEVRRTERPEDAMDSDTEMQD
jgi:structural maintenance of chromosome 3 (chondroitin sulfate proteoglycan 6)